MSITPEEKTLRIAIQGEPGSNSHMAALQLFRHSDKAPRIIPCTLSAEVCERVVADQADCAVLPIENSLHGSVAEHYDLLLEHDLTIVAETMLRVRHNVIAAPGVALAQVRRVLSHPVALSQCRHWLRAHPSIEAVPFYDTAGAVKHLMSTGARDLAALAPALAAQHYGATVLLGGVEDHAENYTRFLVLRRARAGREIAVPSLEPAAPTRLSVAFTLDHQPGSLVHALDAFRAAGLNLTRIESRPVPGKPWEYVFFVDLTFAGEAQLQEAVKGLQQNCRSVKELGRYHTA